MSMDDRPKHLDDLLAHVAENLPDDEAAIASPAETLAAQEEASTARAAALIAPIEARVRDLKAQERAKVRRHTLLDAADLAMALDFEQLGRGDTEFVSFEHAWNLGTVDVSKALRRLADETQPAEAEAQPETEASRNRRALVHNAITDALSQAGDWVPLSVRIAATRAALAEVDAWHAGDQPAIDTPQAEACPPGCIACATDESHDPAPAAQARQDGAQPS
ncbi:hypothetical protein ACIGCZ_29270 [Streptomyces nigra]|uniref:hypothetical protein n=1 Tax=Streptomyces nigra TaxID=1827580 RepID=UPI0037D02B1A